MPIITVISRAGEERQVAAEIGRTLMQVVRDDSGFEDLVAMCGGCLSCATCHVHVEGAAEGVLPPLGPDEDDLLTGSPGRSASSRLSCQVPITEKLEGIRVRIADEG
ncbi:2Fe-2S iron-sulfur cluster-binding protein [Niveispirillum sp.]|uniref:2Fe-2S iron-sulfur cluster-binding protein n=1 Tax=Niveispirillum sp. TaxID=1917217 RepID=UPI001B3FAFA3|nr:2Fe-2S iron-sulfur cluster-binding protein [Niveispirillum sp.]MBP7335275.1 2Fe-2S iron-sulfur cluster binding domain-containing protein [Niveispirillum sp.]